MSGRIRQGSLQILRVPGALVLLASLGLAGCGGGGGPAASPAPKSGLVPDSRSLAATAAINDAAPGATLVIDVLNAPSAAQYVRLRYTASGVLSATVDWPAGTQIQVQVAFKDPAGLAPGSYADSMIFELCEDGNCNKLVPGFSVTVPVSYVVTQPAAGNAPTVTLNPGQLSASDSTYGPGGLQPLQAPLTFDLDLAHFGKPPAITVSSTHAAVQYTSVNVSGLTLATVQLAMATPSTLAAGTYHDTVTVDVCLAADCINRVAGSPFTLAVDFTVGGGGVVSGPAGYSWRYAPSGAAMIAWDAHSQRLVGVAAQPAQLLLIDPATGLVDQSFALGCTPYLGPAVSDDGVYAYIGCGDAYAAHFIERVRLADHALLDSTPLPAGQSIQELHVAPGNDALLAVSTNDASGSQAIQLYDGSLAVTDALAWSNGVGMTSHPGLAWGADAGTLYAYDPVSDLLRTFHPAGGSLGSPADLTVDLDDVRPSWSAITYQQGLLLESHGAVYDVASGQVLRRLDLHTPATAGMGDPYYSVAALDATARRAYFWYLNVSSMTIQSFDIDTGATIGYIPTDSRSTCCVVRWGSDGLAYLLSGSADGLVLLNGPFVAP
jgi:hypothetical protein